MKIRNEEELLELLSNDLKFRKQELSHIKMTLSAARTHEKNALSRAGIAMLYAHFEGFVRAASTAYMNFVSHKSLSHQRLRVNFVAASLRSQIQELGQINRATTVVRTVEELFEKSGETATFGWSGELDCRNNLTGEVLAEIMCLVGIPFGPYETKRQFIDQSLVSKRNEIAHGQPIRVEEQEFLDAHTTVVQLIEQFRTDIENAAVTAAYLRS